MEGAIPLWVEGQLLWITGLNERTTCRDIIEWVIDCEQHPTPTADRTKYKIVERWKRMERHLPGKCKILRVWHAWGEERKNVRFLFRKRRRKNNFYSYDFKLYESPELVMHRPRFGGCAGLRKIRVRKSFLDKDATKLRDIVFTQKEILSRQQQKLADKDEEIDRYETMIHLNRVEKVGENYLQDTYLGKDTPQDEDEDKKEDDDVSQTSYDTNHTLQEATELYERILEISRRIEKQEDNIRVLSAQIRYSISLKDPICELVDDFSFFAELKADDDKLDAYLYKTKIRIECLAALNKSQKLAIDHNERTLEEYNKIYEHKLSYMQQLENDLAQVDIETHSIQHSCSSPKYNFKDKSMQRRGFVEANADVIFIDNNSDTGLSSLHSSSDDGYILDTLV